MKELQRERLLSGELLCCALLELVVVRIAYGIQRSKSVPYLSSAAWAIVLGIVFGLVLSQISKEGAKDVGLDPQVIFFGLLPPIILEAGFSMKRRGFFANFWDVFLLGIVGTILSTVGIAVALYWLGQTSLIGTSLSPAEAVQYGSLISAIDPIASQLVLRKSHVPALLPELVFGERSLNNAITVAVFTLCQERVQSGDTSISLSNGMALLSQVGGVCVGSLLLACGVGYASAYLLQNADDALKQHPTLEISTLILFAYSSYLAGEYFHLSGHLCVFFSGAFIHHYHLHDVSHASATTFRQLLRTLSFLSETFLFIYLGVSLFAYADRMVWDWSFVAASLLVCVLVRATTTFPLCYVAGLWRLHAIPAKYMVVVWLSGLRGVIAFALSLNVRTLESSPVHAAIIRSSTLFTVLSSTIALTVIMGPLVRCLGLAHTCETHAHQRREQTPLFSSSSEEEAAWIRDAWTDFDECHLQPHFGHGEPRG